MTDSLEHPVVTIDPNVPPRFRPADLRVVRAMCGQSLMAMVSGDDDADRMAALAFFAMRRADPTAPAKDLWEQAEQVDVEMVTSGVDPTSGDGSTPSPLSATTGS